MPKHDGEKSMLVKARSSQPHEAMARVNVGEGAQGTSWLCHQRTSPMRLGGQLSSFNCVIAELRKHCEYNENIL